MDEWKHYFLTINAGSSSVKFALFENTEFSRVAEGKIDRIGLPGSTLSATLRIEDEEKVDLPIDIPDHTRAVDELLKFLSVHLKGSTLSGIGHRIVHGLNFTAHQRITPEVLAELHQIARYAPEHLPQEIAFIEEFARRFPDVLQVACFDTVFHSTLLSEASRFPISRELFAKGVKRYGFHGLSLEYVREHLATLLEGDRSRGKIIVLHLGSGASVTAMRDGASVDTSMGFTPLGGIPMATRSGDLDPGVVLALPELLGISFDEVRDVLNRRSGLLGMSETSPHMRDLLDRVHGDERARDAIAVYCYQIKKYIGAYAAALGGVDAIVFSGGVGENAPEVRAQILAGLGFLGIALDPERNNANAKTISSPDSRVVVRVIPTDEEVVIAKTVRRLSGIL
jgi:acetate kinase